MQSFPVSLTLYGHSSGWLLRVYPLFTCMFLLDWVMPELTSSQERDLCVEFTFKGQPCNFLQNFFRRKTPRPPPPPLQIHMQIPTVKCSQSGIYLSPNTILFSLWSAHFCPAAPTSMLIMVPGSHLKQQPEWGKQHLNLIFISGLILMD